MGNSLSSPTKDETRRVNRLSKPLTKKPSTLNTSHLPHHETDGPELNSGLIGWQNPWVGSNISKDVVKNKPVKRPDIPPTLPEFKPDLSKWNLIGDGIDIEEPPALNPQEVDPISPISPVSPRSGSLSASPSVRRASCQPASHTLPPRPSLDLGRPKRANSIQTTPLQRHRSAIYGDKAHEATSSNTHFTVGNPRFSLTRRRSLLTRPGIATRRTTAAVTRRFPSPIGEPECPSEDHSDSNTLHWPLPPRQRSSLPATTVRPNSPTDPRYTQLGALKLGSLRVVNGSASPCPSERIPLGKNTQSGPTLALDRLETMRANGGNTLEIPAVPADLQKSDDVPGSPFSFEKSPTITVQPRHKSIFTETEDEGIAMCDEGEVGGGGLSQSQSNKSDTDPVESTTDRSTSRSLNKTDSGYSSATSVHSVYRSRTRASFDSQTSGSCTDSAKGVAVTEPFNSIQQEIKPGFGPGNFSQLYPNSTRWYDSSTPSSQSGSMPGSASGSRVRARRSTLCAPRNTEYQTFLSASTSTSTLTSTSQEYQEKSQALFSRGPLYADRFSTSTLNVMHDSSSTATLETLNDNRPSKSKHDKSISGSSASSFTSTSASASASTSSKSRSRSRSKKTFPWRHNSIIEIPQLPTILSPDHLQEIEAGAGSGELGETEIPTSNPNPDQVHRGRPRSRSQDLRRKRLTKTRPSDANANVMMNSSYVI